MPPMVTDHQNPDYIADHAEKKMIGKALQVHAPDVTLSDGKGFWPLGRFDHETPQLRIKIVGKLWTGHLLITLHDLVNVRVNLSMKDRKSTRLNSSHVKISYAVF